MYGSEKYRVFTSCANSALPSALANTKILYVLPAGCDIFEKVRYFRIDGPGTTSKSILHHIIVGLTLVFTLTSYSQINQFDITDEQFPVADLVIGEDDYIIIMVWTD